MSDIVFVFRGIFGFCGFALSSLMTTTIYWPKNTGGKFFRTYPRSAVGPMMICVTIYSFFMNLLPAFWHPIPMEGGACRIFRGFSIPFFSAFVGFFAINMYSLYLVIVKSIVVPDQAERFIKYKLWAVWALLLINVCIVLFLPTGVVDSATSGNSSIVEVAECLGGPPTRIFVIVLNFGYAIVGSFFTVKILRTYYKVVNAVDRDVDYTFVYKTTILYFVSTLPAILLSVFASLFLSVNWFTILVVIAFGISGIALPVFFFTTGAWQAMLDRRPVLKAALTSYGPSGVMTSLSNLSFRSVGSRRDDSDDTDVQEGDPEGITIVDDQPQ